MSGFAQEIVLISRTIEELLKNPAINILLGAAIGSILTYSCSIRLIRRQNFDAAAGNFRSAFVEAQRLLDESKSFDIEAPSGTGVKEILEKQIIVHEHAMHLFRPYLSKSKRSSFDQTWKLYYSQQSKFAECLSDYNPEPVAPNINNPAHEGQTRKLALDRIESLLEFAKPK